MTDTRKKASMSQVLADIKPYITKKFMAAPCINNVLKSAEKLCWNDKCTHVPFQAHHTFR